ncbi:signal peptide peptidase SppA [Sphingorhabdus sp.]|uniref:signal peptide peptidase SppA n=1 Tax=Sphingorhabdus sp. TaxID=1902408 RepID=UPI002629C42D|nr:signal peptide peptidase SppA [Sphingorhabdus sp.]MDH4398915.1 signal peptide peptidase SppA [Sphingorhabdus sp.]
MQFVRVSWKILVGLKDLLVLLFMLLFFAAIFALLNASPNPAMVRDGALLLKLEGVVSEQPAEIDTLTTLTSSAASVGEMRQRDIVRALKLAETDDRVKAVVVDMDRFMGGGQASLAAIGSSLDGVKKAGKPVYAFATAYTDDSYQLAAHATQIWMDPLGGAMLTGPGGSQPYFKGLLDRLGVKANIYRVGTYKSAVEPFMRSDQSEASKAAIKGVYDEIWGQWKAAVAKARPQARLEQMLTDPAAAVEGAQGNLAQLALSSKLVDTLGDRVAFGKFVASKVGADDKKTTGGFANTPMDAFLAHYGPASAGKQIGVITIAGTIVDGEGGPGSAAGDTVSGLIYDALDNKDLKALVVRVDSPGGSVMASEKIRLAIEAAKAKKIPVIVSMANLAASGGYWISLPADVIFADPSTITGSIGIFAVIPSAEVGLAKIGVNADGVKTTPLSGEPDVLNGFSPEFDRVAQSAIENGYRQFLNRVAAARKKTPAQVDAIAQGRVWAGGTARRLGLVDRTGGMNDAFAEAAKRAGLKSDGWHAEYIEPPVSFTETLLQGLMPKRAQATAPMDIFAHAAWQQNLFAQRVARDLNMLTGVKGVQAACLECGDFASPAPSPTDKSWLAILIKAIS